MQQELDASNATRVSRELAEIDAALERLYQTPGIRYLPGHRQRHPPGSA